MDEASTVNYSILAAALFATAFITVLVLSVWYGYIKRGKCSLTWTCLQTLASHHILLVIKLWKSLITDYSPDY